MNASGTRPVEGTRGFHRDNAAFRPARHGCQRGGGTPRYVAAVNSIIAEDGDIEPLITGLINVSALLANLVAGAAGLVDRVQVTLFPVTTGQTGLDLIFQGAADFELEPVESQTLDGHIQEPIYRPILHVANVSGRSAARADVRFASCTGGQVVGSWAASRAVYAVGRRAATRAIGDSPAYRTTSRVR